MTHRVLFKVEIYREGDLYVGICPELEVSSFGETPVGNVLVLSRLTFCN